MRAERTVVKGQLVDEVKEENDLAKARRTRETKYLNQIGDLEETGLMLREAWADILQSSNRQLIEMRQQLHVIRIDRDDTRRRVRDTRNAQYAFEDELLEALTEAKLQAAQLALEIDTIAMQLKDARARAAAAEAPRDDERR